MPEVPVPPIRFGAAETLLEERILRLEHHVISLENSIRTVLPSALNYLSPSPMFRTIPSDFNDAAAEALCYYGHGPGFVSLYNQSSQEDRVKLLERIPKRESYTYSGIYGCFIQVVSLEDFFKNKITINPAYVADVSEKYGVFHDQCAGQFPSFTHIVNLVKEYRPEKATYFEIVSGEKHKRFVLLPTDRKWEEPIDYIVVEMGETFLQRYSRIYYSEFEDRWLHLYNTESGTPRDYDVVQNWAVERYGYVVQPESAKTAVKNTLAYLTHTILPHLREKCNEANLEACGTENFEQCWFVSSGGMRIYRHGRTYGSIDVYIPGLPGIALNRDGVCLIESTPEQYEIADSRRLVSRASFSGGWNGSTPVHNLMDTAEKLGSTLLNLLCEYIKRFDDSITLTVEKSPETTE